MYYLDKKGKRAKGRGGWGGVAWRESDHGPPFSFQLLPPHVPFSSCPGPCDICPSGKRPGASHSHNIRCLWGSLICMIICKVFKIDRWYKSGVRSNNLNEMFNPHTSTNENHSRYSGIMCAAMHVTLEISHCLSESDNFWTWTQRFEGWAEEGYPRS